MLGSTTCPSPSGPTCWRSTRAHAPWPPDLGTLDRTLCYYRALGQKWPQFAAPWALAQHLGQATPHTHTGDGANVDDGARALGCHAGRKGARQPHRRLQTERVKCCCAIAGVGGAAVAYAAHTAWAGGRHVCAGGKGACPVQHCLANTSAAAVAGKPAAPLCQRTWRFSASTQSHASGLPAGPAARSRTVSAQGATKVHLRC